MSKLHTIDERMRELFGGPDAPLTTDELVAGGALVDATAVYAEGNGTDPSRQPRLLFTPDAWDDLADWNSDNHSFQDVSGRIHDVVTASGFWHPLTGRCRTDMLNQRTVFSLVRIPNTRQASVPRRATAAVTVAVEQGRPTLTFCLPYE